LNKKIDPFEETSICDQ